MGNPAEELVTAWLQERKGFFTMSNIKLPSRKEIDILAYKPGKRVWVEVSVPIQPRGLKKAERLRKTIESYMKDFKDKEKVEAVRKHFHSNNFERWVVYGKLPLARSTDECEKFEKSLKKRGIKPIFFKDVLEDLKKLRFYRSDTPRGYLRIISTFTE